MLSSCSALLGQLHYFYDGEVNLPPDEHTELFKRIPEVGEGYTVIGTNNTYNHDQFPTHLIDCL
jgi:hypothetical protein